MTQHDTEDAPLTYQWPGITEAQMAVFFATAARFARAKPWIVAPEARGPVGIDAPSAGLQQAVGVVMGEQGLSRGLAIFDTFDDMEAFLESGYSDDPDAPMPAHVALLLEPGEELEAGMRREAASAGWEIVDKLYPWLAAMDEAGEPREVTAEDLRRVEVAAKAVAAHAEAVGAVGGYRVPCVGTYAVEHAGQVHSVHIEDPVGAGASLRALKEPFEIALTIDESEDDDALNARLDRYVEGALSRFDFSPERAALPVEVPDILPLLFDATFDECAAGLNMLSPDVLRVFLFELMPEHVVIDPKDAADCVKVVRAFLEFLQREFQLASAQACLGVLDHRVVVDLRKALGTRSKWSTNKAEAMRELN